MDLESYSVVAPNKHEARLKAIDCFKDDDEWYGSEEAENVTISDCEIIDEMEEY